MAQQRLFEDPARPSFNFTDHMRSLCVDISQRLPELKHIDMHRVAVSFNRSRKRVKHGMWASLTPMRFEGGQSETVRHGRRYAAQKLLDKEGREMLYILSFYLPRFLDLTFDEKLSTVFHELWHISPQFDGDIRRHPGRCFAHSGSQKEYDAMTELLAQKWLRRDPPPERYEFLKYPFHDLVRRCGPVMGTRIPHPKLLPIDG